MDFGRIGGHAIGFRCHSGCDLAVALRFTGAGPVAAKRDPPGILAVLPRRGCRGDRLAGICPSPPDPAPFGPVSSTCHRGGLGHLACRAAGPGGPRPTVDPVAWTGDDPDADRHGLAGDQRRPKPSDRHPVSYDEQFGLGPVRQFRPILQPSAAFYRAVRPGRGAGVALRSLDAAARAGPKALGSKPEWVESRHASEARPLQPRHPADGCCRRVSPFRPANAGTAYPDWRLDWRRGCLCHGRLKAGSVFWGTVARRAVSDPLSGSGSRLPS